MFVFVLPLFVACEIDNTDESSFSDEPSSDYNFTVNISKKAFNVNKINIIPKDNSIVIYTNEYRLNGQYSPVIGVESPNRTIVSVRATPLEDGYEFDVVDKAVETNNGVIPYNGFALSIPNDMLQGVRLNVGQIIGVEEPNKIAALFERTDYAAISPDYLSSIATRRVNLVDPEFGFEEDKIYYITENFKGEEISVENITVTAKVSSNNNFKVVSVEKKNNIETPLKDEVMFVFTGDVNVAFAKHYYNNAQRVNFTNLNKCNSFSDKPAILINNNVFELNENNLNVCSVDKDGIYVFNGDYSSSVTPAFNSKRVDIVIIDDYVAFIANENERTLIPEGNGFVISFVGEEAVSKIQEFKIGKSVKTAFIDYFTIPNKYVEINGRYFGFDFQNAVRAPEGVSVVYTGDYGKTTGTNIYGTEIVVADGKVTEVNIGKGDSQIPENGFVLSVHKDSESYNEVRNVKVGDSASIGFGGDVYGINVLDIDGVNSVRNENTLILYKGKASTQTNPYGYEIAVDNNGLSVSDGYDGNMKIPSGGFVLSGHGSKKTALEEAYAVGQTVVLENNKVILIKTPYQRLAAAKKDYASVSDKLDVAKKSLLNIDYNGISGQIELLNNTLLEAENAFDSFDFECALEKADAVISTCKNLQYSFYESKGVENRAVWYRATEKNDSEVKATVQKMKTLNINALYLETWYEGYCIGSKVDVEGIDKHPNSANYDVLEAFIRIGHQEGIEVHAWVHNFFVGYYYKDGRTYYNKSFDDYKDKYLVDINGKDYFYYTANDNYFIFLNPNDRECRDLLLNIYEQLINNYDLDGLHLDYVRMPELNYGKDDFGYNQDIIDAFAKETGIKTDPRTFIKNSEESRKWINFRCNIITSFVGEVYDMIRENNKDIWLSAALYPDLNMAKNDIFQDVSSIVNKGYLDEVFSMSYGVDNGSVMPSVQSYNKVTEGKAFYSAGIAAFLETTEANFAKQLDNVFDYGADGVSIFALASITNSLYYKPITEGSLRAPSVQINKLSLTANAQMEYIKSKMDNLSTVYKSFDSDDIAYIKSQCDVIIELSQDFDVHNASVAQKINWCDNAISEINTIKDNIAEKFGQNNDSRSVLSEFESLEYWLELSLCRLNTRK